MPVRMSKFRPEYSICTGINPEIVAWCITSSSGNRNAWIPMIAANDVDAAMRPPTRDSAVTSANRIGTAAATSNGGGRGVQSRSAPPDASEYSATISNATTTPAIIATARPARPTSATVSAATTIAIDIIPIATTLSSTAPSYSPFLRRYRLIDQRGDPRIDFPRVELE